MTITTNNPEALGWKYEYVGGISTLDGVVTEWPDSLPTLTQELVDAAEVEYENKEAYKGKRAEAYPLIQDQLDMQYWDLKNSTTTWKDAIEEVKNAYPK